MNTEKLLLDGILSDTSNFSTLIANSDQPALANMIIDYMLSNYPPFMVLEMVSRVYISNIPYCFDEWHKNSKYNKEPNSGSWSKSIHATFLKKVNLKYPLHECTFNINGCGENFLHRVVRQFYISDYDCKKRHNVILSAIYDLKIPVDIPNTEGKYAKDILLERKNKDLEKFNKEYIKANSSADMFNELELLLDYNAQQIII